MQVFFKGCLSYVQAFSKAYALGFIGILKRANSGYDKEKKKRNMSVVIIIKIILYLFK